MSRKKIVAGNWKMNKTWVEAFDLTTSIKEKTKGAKEVEKILIPPFPFLQMASVILNGEKGFFTGAQNCSEHVKGAYTGEVSAAMIQSAGCRYVLVGHSERRIYFKEDSSQLSMKMARALELGLQVIYCFGESLAERKNGKHFDTVKDQLASVLSGFPKNASPSLVLAYEPVWAIGTGENATPAQAQEMHAFVRETVAELLGGSVAGSISILYGGSCNPKNSRELFSCKDVDGGLIGGASLNAEDFQAIVESF